LLPSTLRLVKAATNAIHLIAGLLITMAQPPQAMKVMTAPHLQQITKPTKVHHLQDLTAQTGLSHTPHTTEAGLASPSDVPTMVITGALTAAAGVVAVEEGIATRALHPSVAGRRATST
jgi:hypothetical protein